VDRAEAARLQPHHVEDFFTAAFTDLGGNLRSRESHRYEIKSVPALVKDMDRIKARYPGWDLEAMRKEWKAWCQKRGFTPQRPAAHFSKFMNTHEKRNGQP